MIMRKPKYSKEVFGQMADKIYQASIRAIVDPAHIGRIVAIDVDSGDYEVADTLREATDILHQRRPESQTFCRRIGPDSAVTRFYGFRVPQVAP